MNGKIIKWMEKDYLNERMVGNTLVNFKMGKDKDKGNYTGRMEEYTMDNGKKENRMDLLLIVILMESKKLDNG